MRPARMRRLVLLALAMLAVACRGDLPAVQSAGVRVVQIRAPGADASAPLVVWLHGRGGRPERFAGWWRDFPVPIEVALPQGFIPSGNGWAWFDWPYGMSDADLAKVVGAAEERLWPAIAEVAHGRKLIVVGFSQGAVMAYVIAARHPDAVVCAIPISGGAPYDLLPRGHAPAAPVYALHGTADEIIPIGYARATVAAFQAAGATAELHEYAGVGHDVTDEMRAELTARVRAALGR